MHFLESHPIERDGAAYVCRICGWRAVPIRGGRLFTIEALLAAEREMLKWAA